jgi:hypothetical protein
MRILLDECVPRRFRRELAGHEVQTVTEIGWVSLTNGELLAAASDMFDVFLTTDKRLGDQQNISRFSIAVVVLAAKRNKLEFLPPLVWELRKSLPEVKPGRLYRFE